MFSLDGARRFMNPDTNMQNFPAVPSSLNASDHEMRDYNAPDQARTHNTASQYTPYLGLPSRLSQIWLNRWTILIILIIVRLLIATQDLEHDLNNAKEQALSACTSVENVGSAMASMPHYLSDGVNAMAADGITKAINGLMSMLSMSVTVVEEIVLFYINMLTSTYVCLITLVVAGSLHAAIAIIEEVAHFINESISGLTGELAKGVSAFEGDFNKFLGAFNSIPSLFGGKPSKPPQINLSQPIDALNHIAINTTKFDAGLQKLNNSIPNFEEVHNATNNVIRLPFEKIKGLINEAKVGYVFDKTVFPVAQKQALTFCSDSPALENFFNGLTKVAMKFKTIFLALLIVAAVLVCVPMGYAEVWRYRSMQKRSNAIEVNAFDPMDVVYIASRPYTAGAGLWAGEKFSGQKTRILARWFIAYTTTLPVLFVLALAASGLITGLFKYLMLKAIEKEVPQLLHEVGDFADVVVKALDKASVNWSVGANEVINSTNSKVNDDVFDWVSSSTTTLNDTLNAFSNHMIKSLNSTFGGTILYKPVEGLYECLIGLKIAGIEAGLTWIHDNAQVSFPGFRDDVFSLGAMASLASNSSKTDSFLAAPGNTTMDGISSAVTKVTSKLADSVLQEMVISACLIGVWIIIILMGIARITYAMLTRDKTRAEGGAVGYINNNPPPPLPASTADYPVEPQAPYPVEPTHLATATFPMSGSRHQEDLYPSPEYYEEREHDEKMLGAVASSMTHQSPAPRYQSAYGTYGYMGDDSYPMDNKHS